jgi:hypothetical protein
MSNSDVFGQLVSSNVHEIIIPGNPVAPQAVSDFIHVVLIPGTPSFPETRLRPRPCRSRTICSRASYRGRE